MTGPAAGAKAGAWAGPGTTGAGEGAEAAEAAAAEAAAAAAAAAALRWPARRASIIATARGGSHAEAVPLSSPPSKRCGASCAWRSAGVGRRVASICMQDSMSGRSSSGRPSRLGPSRSSMNTVSTGFAPWYGGCPVAAKTSVEPSEKTSLAPLTLRESLACSGDM